MDLKKHAQYGTLTFDQVDANWAGIENETQLIRALVQLLSGVPPEDIPELGTAATRDVTTSNTDSTLGRVLKVGDAGVLGHFDGRSGVGAPGRLPSDVWGTGTKFFFASGGQDGVGVPGVVGYGVVVEHGQYTDSSGESGAAQRFFSTAGRIFYQWQVSGGAWSDWIEMLHTGNTGTAVTRDVGTSPGNLMEVGAFGLQPMPPDTSSHISETLSIWKDSGGPSTVNRPLGFTYGSGISIPYEAGHTASLSFSMNGRIFYSNYVSGVVTSRELYHTGNTIVDSNGFIKEV